MMRVITGSARGRRLETLPGDQTYNRIRQRGVVLYDPI